MTLCEDATDAIRLTLGEGLYGYHTVKFGAAAIDDPKERMIVPLSVLAFGTGNAFTTLVRHGLEREALIHQRQTIEYYLRIKHYSLYRRAALIDRLFDSIAEEKRFLNENSQHFGSIRRPEDVDTLLNDMWPLIGGKPGVVVSEQRFTSQLSQYRAKVRIPQLSVPQLADRYCLGPDYGLFYSIPSKMSHGSEFIRGYAERYGRMQYYSDVSNMAQKVAIVSEYLIAIVAVLQKHVICQEQVDVGGLRSRLATSRRELRIHRPRKRRA